MRRVARRLVLTRHSKKLIEAMARTNPITFLQQVRTEVGKVTWPSRNEVLISTLMVLVLVAVASVFFLAVDQIISLIIQYVLGIA